MPNYDYECTDCGYTFEKFQSMTEDKLKTCPECKKDTLVRLIGGGSGVVFKGSGFYETDYKSKPQPAPSCSESSCPKAKNGTCPGAD